MGRRDLKNRIHSLLEMPDFAGHLEAFQSESPGALCSTLISFLPSPDETIKYRAAAALGAVVARLADSNIEAAREIIRRLHWSLTEESGAIGWGAPEAIGEICAHHAGLAAEFGAVLLSYICEPNHLGNPVLLRGALWGIGRLAEAQPQLLRQYGVVEKIKPYLESPDETLRETANHVLAGLNADAGGYATLPG